MHLLDSHALLWWAIEPRKLSEAARSLLSTTPRLRVSVASIWELEIKAVAGKLDRPADLWDDLPRFGIDVLAIELPDTLAAARLPMRHRDPFDRMIIAQALRRGLTIVTRDPVFTSYDVPVLAA